MHISIRFEITIGRDNTKVLTRGSWARLQAIVRSRDRATCHYCGKYTSDGHVDHVLPLSKGGSDDLENLVWSCPTCNLSKGSEMEVSVLPPEELPQISPECAEALLTKAVNFSEPGLHKFGLSRRQFYRLREQFLDDGFILVNPAGVQQPLLWTEKGEEWLRGQVVPKPTLLEEA